MEKKYHVHSVTRNDVADATVIPRRYIAHIHDVGKGEAHRHDEAPAWKVITKGKEHNVRSDKSVTSDILGSKHNGAIIHGTSDGSWLTLHDEPGFCLIRNEADTFLVRIEPTPELDAENNAEYAEGYDHEHMMEADGLRIRHKHMSSDKAHVHYGESHEPRASIKSLGEVELMPLRPDGLRILFPKWVREHPWYMIWPFWDSWPGHAKAHFNSSGVNDLWPGALTVLTQGWKIAIATTLWFYGRDFDGTHNNEHAFYRAALWAILGQSIVLTACWIYIWPQGLVNVAFTLVNYALYVNGWVLSIMTLYERVEPVYGVRPEWALIPALAPPVYVTTRTILFFPSAKRRIRFLLAALSNRGVPLELNFHVVGPAETRQSHQFLTMLNSWAMVSTLVSKGVIFNLEIPGPLAAAAHGAHLVSIWWASLYAIRCRQIALDCFVVADETPLDERWMGGKTNGVVPGDTIGRRQADDDDNRSPVKDDSRRGQSRCCERFGLMFT